MAIVILAFKAVFPILAPMTVGFVAKKAGLLEDGFIRKANRMVFWLFLPALIFFNLYATDFMKYLDIRLMIFIAAATLLVFIIAFFTVPRFEKENPNRGVIVQGMTRGNVVYVGLPVLTTLVGDTYAGLMAVAIVITVIFYNVTSVIGLETFRHSKVAIVPILKGIAKNPLIMGAVVGVAFAMLNIPLPSPVLDVLKSMSSAATPLALILLGGSIAFTDAKKYWKQILSTVLVKLIIAPAIFIPIAILLGFTHYELVIVFVVLSAPTAVASFAVAQSMEGNGSLAVQIVAWSSTLSLGTIFLWIIILQNYILG